MSDVFQHFDFSQINARLQQIEGGRNAFVDPEVPTSRNDRHNGPDRSIFRIHFGSGSNVIDGQDAELAMIAKAVHRAPGCTVEVRGHTDACGTHATNMRLAAERAMAVKRALIYRGIDCGRIEMFSYGPGRPKAGARTAADNRRVEVTLVRTGR